MPYQIVGSDENVDKFKEFVGTLCRYKTRTITSVRRERIVTKEGDCDLFRFDDIAMRHLLRRHRVHHRRRRAYPVCEARRS